jgi:hypothetical protein
MMSDEQIVFFSVMALGVVLLAGGAAVAQINSRHTKIENRTVVDFVSVKASRFSKDQ